MKGTGWRVARFRRRVAACASVGLRADAEAGEAAVEGAAGEAEDARGFGDVAALGGEGALDEVALDLLEGHLLELGGDFAAAEHERLDGDLVARGEEGGALDDVLELADVARPAVGEEGFHGGGGQ